MIISLPCAAGGGYFSGAVSRIHMGVLVGSGSGSHLAMCAFSAPFFLYYSYIEGFSAPPMEIGAVQVDTKRGIPGDSLLTYQLPCPISPPYAWREDKEARYSF